MNLLGHTESLSIQIYGINSDNIIELNARRVEKLNVDFAAVVQTAVKNLSHVQKWIIIEFLKFGWTKSWSFGGVN